MVKMFRDCHLFDNSLTVADIDLAFADICRASLLAVVEFLLFALFVVAGSVTLLLFASFWACWLSLLTTIYFRRASHASLPTSGNPQKVHLFVQQYMCISTFI